MNALSISTISGSFDHDRRHTLARRAASNTPGAPSSPRSACCSTASSASCSATPASRTPTTRSSSAFRGTGPDAADEPARRLVAVVAQPALPCRRAARDGGLGAPPGLRRGPARGVRRTHSRGPGQAGGGGARARRGHPCQPVDALDRDQQRVLRRSATPWSPTCPTRRCGPRTTTARAITPRGKHRERTGKTNARTPSLLKEPSRPQPRVGEPALDEHPAVQHERPGRIHRPCPQLRDRHPPSVGDLLGLVARRPMVARLEREQVAPQPARALVVDEREQRCEWRTGHTELLGQLPRRGVCGSSPGPITTPPSNRAARASPAWSPTAGGRGLAARRRCATAPHRPCRSDRAYTSPRGATPTTAPSSS